MLTKEYTILEPFTRALWRPLTFKEVKRLSNNKSDNYVHTSLKDLVRSGILKEKRIGNNVLYSLSDNNFALETAGYIAQHKAHISKHIPNENIKKIMAKVKTAFYSLIITGSYASNRHKKTSDLDLVIICDDNQKPDNILSEIMTESELMVPEVHPYVFTQSQLFEMLIDKEENYGKEVVRNNLVITGGKQFYSIIMGAINNGFNG
jgi:predicted nucleotidyltransferase